MSMPAQTWLDIQDGAMLLLIVGSGLYPGEIITLTVPMLRPDSSVPNIAVPAHGRVPKCACLVLPFAAERVLQVMSGESGEPGTRAVDRATEVCFGRGPRQRIRRGAVRTPPFVITPRS